MIFSGPSILPQSHVLGLSNSNHVLSVPCCLKALEYDHFISCPDVYTWPPALSRSLGCSSPVYVVIFTSDKAYWGEIFLKVQFNVHTF